MNGFKALTVSLYAFLLSFVGVQCRYIPTGASKWGDATWYRTGLGNCGAWSNPTDFIAAVALPEYGDGHKCWQRIRVWYQGRSIDATVVDSCQGCSPSDVDLSPSAFMALAPLAVGRLHGVSWGYIN